MLLIICMAVSGILAVFCLLQVIIGREFVRLSRRQGTPAQIRREYLGPTVIAIGGVLIGSDRLIWWAFGLIWVGIILTAASTTRRRART